MLNQRAFGRLLRGLLPSTGVAVLAAGSVSTTQSACTSCSSELVLRVPAATPADRCAACPEVLNGFALTTCDPGGPDVTCAYDTGYGDRADALATLDDAACRGVCADGDALLGCADTELGPACVFRGMCVGGRRHAGMPAFRPSGSGLGAYFGALAFLEACSVEAFARLASDLADAGAPPWLLRACRAAARDEARHARIVLPIARAFGWRGEVDAEPVARGPRSIEALAIENVVEGDRETYGALVVTWIARSLPGAMGRALRGVARDEARHARLSRLIDAWLDTTLDPDARARVRAARREAFAQLVATPADAALRACGLDAEAQHAMKASLGKVLLPSDAFG